MMHYVYLLRLENKDLYCGRSDDLKRRIIEHTKGKVDATKHFLPATLVYYEAFIKKEDAVRREIYLKTTKGKRMVKLMLKESLK